MKKTTGSMKAVEEGLAHIMEHGSQALLLDKIQHRKRLYQRLRYESDNRFDGDVYNFKR